jgi:hypothetical protein
MTESARLPEGGINLRKYAAATLALGLARGALLDALAGDLERVRHVLDITSTSRIAAALSCTEDELAVDWDEQLTRIELDRLKGL